MQPHRSQKVKRSDHGYFQWVLDSLLSVPLERLKTLVLLFQAILPLVAVEHLRGTCARIDTVLSTPRFSRLGRFELHLRTPKDEAARVKEEVAACFPYASARGVLMLDVWC